MYLTVCILGGVFLADGTLHPGRRALTGDEVAAARQSLFELGAEMEDVSIMTPDRVVLRGWMIHPNVAGRDVVMILHGLGDNRLGMIGYAQLLVAHGFTVLLPDSRAHGASGGELATYGLLERSDIRQWFDFLQGRIHPGCIFGFGESMGAAQLLQALDSGTHFCAVAVECPFATFREIAYDRMGQPFHLGPWVGRLPLRSLIEVAFLRARWKYGLAMDSISPESSVAVSGVPVLLIHGQADNNIPVRHSRLIHAHSPKTPLWEVPGAGHCGAISVARREFERKVLEWFDNHDSKYEAATNTSLGK